MERLKIVFAVAALMAMAHTSPGQQLPVASPGLPSGFPVQPSCVVIGDVRNFNYFPLAGRTTVRQAALNAGLLSDSASVSVIRASQDRALWTQMISSTSADSGELILNGDLLVVQSLVPLSEPVRRNAALRTEAGVIVVALADEPIAAGDVLLQTNHMPSPEQRLQISSRFQGRTAITSLTLSDEVAHGDVLTLSRGNKSGLKGFGSLVPTCSEWQETVASPPLPETPGPEAFRINAPGVLPEENSPDLLMSMPTSLEAAEEDASGPATPQTDPFAASAAADVEPTSAVQLVSQAHPAFDSDGPIVAPHPPIEYPELTDTVDTATAPGNMSPWNLVFIGGLLLAGTLILAASLRADPEPEDDANRTKVQQSEQVIAFAAAETTVDRTLSENSLEAESSATQTPVHVSPTAASFADAVHLTSALALREAAQSQITPSSLVSSNEWFGTDWLNSRPQPGAQSVVSRQSTDERMSQVSSIEDVRAEQGTKASAPETTPELPQWIEQSDTESLPGGTENSSDVRKNGFADLEDLLQNRLPIDLCSTRLPLRIALFGRPAGPRRLRIDGAHTTLPAPHMNRSAERGRGKPVMASESTAAADSRDGAAAGSLDRALHNLQGRTDS